MLWSIWLGVPLTHTARIEKGTFCLFVYLFCIFWNNYAAHFYEVSTKINTFLLDLDWRSQTPFLIALKDTGLVAMKMCYFGSLMCFTVCWQIVPKILFSLAALTRGMMVSATGYHHCSRPRPWHSSKYTSGMREGVGGPSKQVYMKVSLFKSFSFQVCEVTEQSN